ncbi:MAG: hypothetical protein GVY36_02185 [Verrucomicrobia bacterium]|jgi:hypothetical protein|nr:hypothetical protein [Verrucomicrobiota bacterium]
MWKQAANLFLRSALVFASVLHAGALELPVRLDYPSKVTDVVLTGVENAEVVFRPTGRDTGGRAYISFDNLLEEGASLYFMFPEEFYDAVGQLKRGSALAALPIIRRETRPFLDVMELSALPGNHLPAVYAYVEALEAAQMWGEAVEVALSIPLAQAPPAALERIGALSHALDKVDEAELTDQLHAHILSPSDYPRQHLVQLMQLADEWRESGVHGKAYSLYRKVEISASPLQTRARLWVAYCSFYLEEAIVPERLLDDLPEVDFKTPDYSLRELIRARLRMREGEYDAAMRSAAVGKTYASPTDSWYPELLFILATLYDGFAMESASEAAHRELSLLFPSSQWAAQSLQILGNQTEN